MTFHLDTLYLGYLKLTPLRLRQIAAAVEAAALDRECGCRVVKRDPHAKFWDAIDAKQRGETPKVLSFTRTLK